jgi:predicted ATPase
VTVTGPPGIGKTRVSLTYTERTLSTGSRTIALFFDLASARTVEEIAVAIGHTLERHARFYITTASALAEVAYGERGQQCMRALERETDNLNAVHERATTGKLGTASVSMALEVLLAVEPIFRTRGPLLEYSALIEPCVERA